MVSGQREQMTNYLADPFDRIVESPFDEALSQRYLVYALSTITARSLPDVRDGLKPVHRRLLWAMRLLKLDPASGYKKCALERPYGIVITGVGGTGVVTIGALLGMAAHLEGRGCSVLDMAGLAQKGGAVVSHVRLAPQSEDIHAVRISAGSASLLLGRSEEHTSELQSLMRISYAVFCLKKKKIHELHNTHKT